MNETHSFASQVKFAVFTFYTILNFVFVPMGLVVLFREKKFGIMGIALIPIILIHFMFRYNRSMRLKDLPAAPNIQSSQIEVWEQLKIPISLYSLLHSSFETKK